MKMFSSSLTILIGATVATLAAGAQSSKSMDQPAMGAMKAAYTGCVEAVNHGGAFLLTHVSDGQMAAKHGDMPMKHDRMMQKADADSMDHAAMPMLPAAVVLTGRSDLRKHAGQRVAVTGTLSQGSAGSARDDLNTLSVDSLKIVAKACSQEGR
jgi:hypothetical protein